MASEVRVRVTGDATGFNQTLTRAKVNAQAFATRMRTMTSGLVGRFGALFSGVAVGMAVRKTIEWADTLADTSRRLDVNVEKLQAWEYAATQTGSSLSALTNTIEKLKKSQADAGRGLSTSIVGMQALGLGQTDDVDTMLNKLAALAQSGRIGGLIGPLKDVAGRGATELIPALKQWQELQHIAERTGVIMKEEQVQVLEKIKDRFTFLGRFMMATLAPAIQWVSEKLIMFQATIKGIAAYAGAATVNPEEGKKGAKSVWKAFAGHIQTLIGSDEIKKNGERLIEEAGKELYGTEPGGGGGNNVFKAYQDAMDEGEKLIRTMRARDKQPGMNDGDGDAPGAPDIGKSRWKSASADSLAKVGLFTASGLNAASIVQKELMYLRKISDNTDPRKQINRWP